jgi:hypothetical protein
MDITAKDFRTWAGTVLAAVALKELGKLWQRNPGEASAPRGGGSRSRRLGVCAAAERSGLPEPHARIGGWSAHIGGQHGIRTAED